MGSQDCDDESNIWSNKMTIMSHKDCEEWAAMIAQMQDDPSYHPKYNKKGVRPVSNDCLLYTSPSPRDRQKSRMPSSA